MTWLGRLGRIQAVLGAGFVIAGLATPAARLGLLIAGVANLGSGLLLVWMAGLMPSIPWVGWRTGMESAAAASDRGAEVMRTLAREPAHRSRLLATGHRGRATVVAVKDTGVMINVSPMVDVELLVDVDDRPAYPVTVRVGMTKVASSGLSVGAVVEVLVDPDDPFDVLLP